MLIVSVSILLHTLFLIWYWQKKNDNENQNTQIVLASSYCIQFEMWVCFLSVDKHGSEFRSTVKWFDFFFDKFGSFQIRLNVSSIAPHAKIKT